MGIHRKFWLKHPALLYAATLLIAASAALFWNTPWQWIFPLLWTVYLVVLRRWPIILLIPAMAAYCHLLYGKLPESKETEGIFSISSLQPHHSPFQKGHVYKGTLYLTDAIVPCSIYSHTPSLFPADRDYAVFGKLNRCGIFDYALKPKSWIAVEGSWSPAQLRFVAKEKYGHFLEKKLNNPRVAKFFAALTTGEVEERLLKYEFGRLGLQHILAISGFHFGVLIAFCAFSLSFLPRFWRFFLLLAAINAYYCFIGPYPGVQRSWLTASAYLLGKMCNRQTNGLNLLGFTLGFEVIYNPLIISNIGFQLSFASCGGILLLYPLAEKPLRSLLPKRSISDLSSFSFLSKHVCLFSHFLRQALSLAVAVNAALLPILLFHFHSFPLLGLFYNLFYPLCIACILFVLLAALIVHVLVPSLAFCLFVPLEWFAARLLDLVSYPPASLDIPLLVSYFPAWLIPFIFFALLSVSIQKRSIDE